MSFFWPASTSAATAASNWSRGVVGEAGEPDVADGAIGEARRLDLGLDDDGAHDLDVERRAAVAHDREGDRRVLRAADRVPRRVDGQPVERRSPSIFVDDVARLQARLLGGRPGDRGDDREPAVRRPASCRSRSRPPRRRSRSSRRCPRTRPRARAQAVLELLARQVQRVGVVERGDHALDRALDERLAVDVAAGVALGDGPVGVPERLEGLRLVDGRARRQRRLAAERPARDEQRGPGEHGDDRDRDRDERSSRRPPARRPGRGSQRAPAVTGVGRSVIGGRVLDPRRVRPPARDGVGSPNEVRPDRQPGSQDAQADARARTRGPPCPGPPSRAGAAGR